MYTLEELGNFLRVRWDVKIGDLLHGQGHKGFGTVICFDFWSLGIFALNY